MAGIEELMARAHAHLKELMQLVPDQNHAPVKTIATVALDNADYSFKSAVDHVEHAIHGTLPEPDMSKTE